jgi:glycerol-3-phosphate dehydrogenase (NAD(P)+)
MQSNPKENAMRMTVLGGGSWGTALANHMASQGYAVTMLVREPHVADDINGNHRNSTYLPDALLCPDIRATTDAEAGLAGAEVCLLAVPCQYMRDTLTHLGRHVPAGAIPVCASKGIEVASLQPMSRVVESTLPEQAGRYAVLSGPSFAREVVQGKPTAVSLACRDAALGEKLREYFSNERFRVYSSTDVTGLEVGGAVKNVIAIAAGVTDGLGFGHNARAALITRGLAEISRLGVALGARQSTFMGLSGMGDLVLTCAGDLSRNRQVGLRLAAGESMAQISGGMIQVAEGVKTTEAVCLLARDLGIEMPIAQSMRRIIVDGETPAQLVRELMTRSLREE